jgi:hypothetical protein
MGRRRVRTVAMERSFILLIILQFYEYEVTQYDAEMGEGGHFVQYIDRCLKMKSEANGYHGWVQVPEDKERYVAYFGDSVGIELVKTVIREKAAKRGLEGPNQTVSSVSGAR